MITLNNISRKYGDFLAVDDVSFTIEKGQIVGLLGHNGAGKTTIMKVLTGYLEANAGSFTVGDVAITAEEQSLQASEDLKSLIGYLPESIPLYPDLSILDYLEYVADLKGLSGDLKQSAISKAVIRTDLTAKAHQTIASLSKGYKQRVGVAQAILNNPPVLILDEPTNGLDPAQIKDMRALIKELAVESTVILSTHIMQEVEAICERVLILERGKLVYDDTLEAVRSLGGLMLRSTCSEADLAGFVRNSVEIESFEKLSGNSSERISSYLLKTNPGTSVDLMPKLTKEFVGRGWQIYSFAPQEQNLEGLFRRLSVA